jgi:hypothetical protein
MSKCEVHYLFLSEVLYPKVIAVRHHKDQNVEIDNTKSDYSFTYWHLVH